MTGHTIAHYTLKEKIGAGGMGEVYRATDSKLNRDVAIKVIPEEFARDPERMARFEREAQVLASLTHGGRRQELVQDAQRFLKVRDLGGVAQDLDGVGDEVGLHRLVNLDIAGVLGGGVSAAARYQQ